MLNNTVFRKTLCSLKGEHLVPFLCGTGGTFAGGDVMILAWTSIEVLGGTIPFNGANKVCVLMELGNLPAIGLLDL